MEKGRHGKRGQGKGEGGMRRGNVGEWRIRDGVRRREKADKRGKVGEGMIGDGILE